MLKHYFQRRPDIDMLEYFCNDNPRRERRNDCAAGAVTAPRSRCIVDATVLLASRGPAATAHHSFASFDRTKQVTLTGTVTEFQWTNPHAWIQVAVTDDQGRETEWGIECGSPNMMARTGWKSTTLKPAHRRTPG